MDLQRSFKKFILNISSLCKSSQLFGVSSFTSKFSQSFSVMAGNILKNQLHCEANMHTDHWRTFQVVVAATCNMGIGKDGKLPWRLPSDLKFFKELTMTTSDPAKKNAVVMGRKTWESIPLQHRPLPGRLNVVLTRSGVVNMASTENIVVCRCLPSALKLLAESPYSMSIDKVFLIGGGQILRESLNAPQCDCIHVTEIDANIECDTFIPTIDVSAFQPWYSSSPIMENNIKYSFVTYVRVKNSSTESSGISGGVKSSCNSQTKKFEGKEFGFLPKIIFQRHDECQYLRLVEEIISSGTQKADGTLSKFGCQLRFNLRKSFPLLTTKMVSWCGVVEELLWFLGSSANVEVYVRNRNASRDKLDRYTNMHVDYKGKGFDQLSDVIYKIKDTPDDRQIILSAWNPSYCKLMPPPPSRILAQFCVANGEVHCQMYQCFADMDIGAPSNIVLYALLTCTIAHVTGLIPGDFIYVIGDAHVCKARIGALREQLQKVPKPFPSLKINPQKKDINSLVAADFEVIGYDYKSCAR